MKFGLSEIVSNYLQKQRDVASGKDANEISYNSRCCIGAKILTMAGSKLISIKND